MSKLQSTHKCYIPAEEVMFTAHILSRHLPSPKQQPPFPPVVLLIGLTFPASDLKRNCH